MRISRLVTAIAATAVVAWLVLDQPSEDERRQADGARLQSMRRALAADVMKAHAECMAEGHPTVRAACLELAAVQARAASDAAAAIDKAAARLASP